MLVKVLAGSASAPCVWKTEINTMGGSLFHSLGRPQFPAAADPGTIGLFMVVQDSQEVQS